VPKAEARDCQIKPKGGVRLISNLECSRPVLAIDLGGTKVITAIFSNGQVIAEERCLTLADEGPPSVINRLLSSVDSILSLNKIGPSQLDSISLAVAGAIDLERGLVTSSPHLPGWVKEKYRVNIFLLNDASAAALGEHRFGVGRGVNNLILLTVLGEHRFGVGRGVNNLILLTVGTGIGGGIIINGRLYNGPGGSAGEIGHMTIDVNGQSCKCGNTGCLETLASGTAMTGEAQRRVNQGESSSLVELVAGNIEGITAEKIGVAARSGDALALDVIAGAGAYLGVGMVNLVNISGQYL